MQIHDSSLDCPIAQDARDANTWWTRFRGLMLASRLQDGEGLRIEPCASIHMMFMRFPIDAVFYDGEGRVTKVARNVRPWTGIAFGGKGAKGVIELPRGAAAHIEAGHQLTFAA